MIVCPHVCIILHLLHRDERDGRAGKWAVMNACNNNHTNKIQSAAPANSIQMSDNAIASAYCFENCTFVQQCVKHDIKIKNIVIQTIDKSINGIAQAEYRVKHKIHILQIIQCEPQILVILSVSVPYFGPLLDGLSGNYWTYINRSQRMNLLTLVIP